jgi:hypothetical protein
MIVLGHYFITLDHRSEYDRLGESASTTANGKELKDTNTRHIHYLTGKQPRL